VLSDTLQDAVATPLAPAASKPVYGIEIMRGPETALARLRAAHGEGHATPFQGPDWIEAWYATVGGTREAEPLIVFVTDRETGQAVITLPLIRRREGGRDVITFADLGVTDYNAPILGPASPVTAVAARRLWASIVKALPAVDLFVFRKMPVEVRGRPNPLALLRGVSPSHSPGFSIAMPDDWEAYLRSLAKKFRKELGRSLRLFEKEGGQALRRIESVDEAQAILPVMNAQQRARLEEVGHTLALDEENYYAFYEGLVRTGLETGTTILTTLTANGEIVAALLGVTDGLSFAMVRLSHAGGDWMKIGPGRLVIERTMHALHEKGIRHFDFSIGDYPYKSGFGVEPSPLVDLISAQSWRGRGSAASDLAKAAIKRALERIGVSVVPQAVKDRYRAYHGSD
jgi:CelD/BcsL family acetyltransferase involved in cellulose biosynthesis